MQAKTLRVAISEMTSAMLREIIEQLAEHSPSLDVVDRGVDRAELLKLSQRERVDVVVFELADGEIATACKNLMDANPETLVIGLAA